MKAATRSRNPGTDPDPDPSTDPSTSPSTSTSTRMRHETVPDAELWRRPRVVNVNLHGDSDSDSSSNYCNNNSNYFYNNNNNNKWKRRKGSNINVRGKSITRWQRAAQGFCRLPPPVLTRVRGSVGRRCCRCWFRVVSCRLVSCCGMTPRVVIAIVNCSCNTFALFPPFPRAHPHSEHPQPRGFFSSCCIPARLSPA